MEMDGAYVLDHAYLKYEGKLWYKQSTLTISEISCISDGTVVRSPTPISREEWRWG